MNPLKAFWHRLSPDQQQGLMRLLIGGGLIGIVLLLAALMPTPRPLEDRQTIVRHLLTDADTRALGMDGLAAGVRQSQRDQGQFQKRLEALEESVRSVQPGSKSDPQNAVSPSLEEVNQLKSSLEAMRQELENLKKAPRTSERPSPKIEDAAIPDLPLPKVAAHSLKQPAPTPWGSLQHPEGTSTVKPLNEIKVLRNQDAAGTETRASRSKSESDLFIPAGTLLSGQLLNGLDAPTGKGARKEPFPVLVRIKHEAILPNRFRADLRECFLIAAGYGDLSAERAYLRAETFSCVRRDGGVLEVPLDAYAVGEDGKLGLRGNVINKQGQLMANSLLAGFAKGVSEAFGRVQIPVIMNGGNHQLSGDVPYQNSFSSAAMEGGAMRGAGTAMDRLANYYMDLAETQFPVIEIDVTRHIEFVVQRGTQLKLALSKAKENDQLSSR